MKLPPIYLLRHGETQWNLEDRRQGRKGSPLTHRGVAQAEAMGRALARELIPGVEWALVSSPQERALHTARIVGEACGLAPTTDDRLMEISMGSWEGLTWPEIDALWPGASEDQRTVHFRIPDGEPYAETAARALSWLESVTQPTIAVSHGITGRVIRTVFLELGQEGFATIPQSRQDEFYLLIDGEIESRTCRHHLGAL
jgi:probable phosphoglycerate mutase